MNGLDPEELDELLAPLRDGPVSLSSSDAESARRARLMPRVHTAVRAAPRLIARRRLVRRVRQGVFLGGALAASLLLASSTFFSAPVQVASTVAPRAHVQVHSQGEEPLAWLADGAAERSIEGSDELATSGELRARDGARAALITEEGAHVDVLPRSRVRMSGARSARDVETIALLEGEVHCRVPKLAQGRSFVITTSKTRVVVHGTDFRVRVGGVHGSCVSVREGLVEVQTETGSVWLGPGKAWGCEEGGPTVSSKKKIRAAEPSTHHHRRARDKGTELAVQAPEPAEDDTIEGTLAVETRLLADALRAEQQGQRAHASTLFARLIATYPSSPLVPEAQAGLARMR